ncbi:mevalonate kinase [Aureococcus anophagefferens]|uniref:Mevalonate kinase n=1 Tax=Aureococcus anophagefferens TaxID=44056 RepID=A0ABR1FYD7_AURAN
MADDGEAPAAKRLRCERLGSRLLAGARGYGKLILLGEHFVVYKVPALVAAVGRYTDCDVALEAGAGIEVADHRPAVSGYKAKKGAEGRAAVALVLDHLGVDYAGQKVKLTFGGDLRGRGRAAPTRARARARADVAARVLDESAALVRPPARAALRSTPGAGLRRPPRARAEAALDAGDVAALGACLYENHALCQKLTVSCAELDALVLARRAARRGRAQDVRARRRAARMIALAPDEQAEAAIKPRSARSRPRPGRPSSPPPPPPPPMSRGTRAAE